MNDKKLTRLIDEAEALAHLLNEKANSILQHCCELRGKSEGVSTSSNDFEHEILKQHILAKREAQLIRKYGKTNI